jgi:hypothetical protein
MERQVGTIAHINSGRAGRSLAASYVLAAAALIATQSSPAASMMQSRMDRLFNTGLKIGKRKPVVREKIRTFTELPKMDKLKIDYPAAFSGIKMAQKLTLLDMAKIYEAEESIDEINDLSTLSNQQVAQFIHGAYAILDNELQSIEDAIKEDSRQAGNKNTLETVRIAIRRNQNAGLISVINGVDPVDPRKLSPEAVTAVKDFEGLYRRIKNVAVKIQAFKKR